ncbi:MAG: sulfotransferase [Elusimicrobiota bacterium]
MDTDIFIHVGLHKTGTTFLQKEIFPKLENCNYIDKAKLENITIEQGKINLISREGLSVSPDKFKLKRSIKPEARFVTAERLKLLFPDAKIIVGVRDKESWINSLYKERVKGEGFITKDEYVKNLDKDFLDFDKYINHLEKLFSDVYVYKFEQLKDEPDRFVKGICNFIGVEVPRYSLETHNKGYTERQIKTILNLDKILSHIFGDFVARKLHVLLRYAIDYVRKDL